MADMGTHMASKEWGYPQATIARWCRDGLIPGATQDKKGSPWHIPLDAQCPREIKTSSLENKE